MLANKAVSALGAQERAAAKGVPRSQDPSVGSQTRAY